MSYLGKCLLKVNEYTLQILLMLNIFFTDDYQVEYMFGRAPATAKPRLFFGDDIFRLLFKPVE